MEERGDRIGLRRFAPLLFIVPFLGLAFLTFIASSLYSVGSGEYYLHLYRTNIYATFLIGEIVWAVAAGSLVLLFAIEMILRKIGIGYNIPAISLVAASAWNLPLGALAFSTNPMSCGWYVNPDDRFLASLYLTAVTFGLLLAGTAAIKFNSIEGGRVSLALKEGASVGFSQIESANVKLARRLCLLNGILALLGLLFLSLQQCLID